MRKGKGERQKHRQKTVHTHQYTVAFDIVLKSRFLLIEAKSSQHYKEMSKCQASMWLCWNKLLLQHCCLLSKTGKCKISSDLEPKIKFWGNKWRGSKYLKWFQEMILIKTQSSVFVWGFSPWQRSALWNLLILTYVLSLQHGLGHKREFL